MKHGLLLVLLLVVGASAARASYVDWSATSATLADGSDPYGVATLVSLVYLADGATLSFDKATGAITSTVYGSLSGTDALDKSASGTDVGTPTSGYFVIVLQDASLLNYSVSLTQLAYNDSLVSATRNVLTPAERWLPESFSNWSAVPEPSSAGLCVLGAMLLALRRKRRQGEGF